MVVLFPVTRCHGSPRDTGNSISWWTIVSRCKCCFKAVKKHLRGKWRFSVNQFNFRMYYNEAAKEDFVESPEGSADLHDRWTAGLSVLFQLASVRNAESQLALNTDELRLRANVIISHSTWLEPPGRCTSAGVCALSYPATVRCILCTHFSGVCAMQTHVWPSVRPAMCVNVAVRMSESPGISTPAFNSSWVRYAAI